MTRVDLVFPPALLAGLRKHLLSGPGGREEAAYVQCGVIRTPGHVRLLARAFDPVPDDAASKSGVHVTVQPEFIATVTKKARLERNALILAHSHPFSRHQVGFSGIDDAGEHDLVPRLMKRIEGPVAAMVFGQQSWATRAHLPGGSETVEAKVMILGSNVGEEALRPDPTLPRQGRLLTRGGQDRLRSLRVAVVGVGGTGSHAVQQLAMLGIRNLVLVDPDVVDATNLNRLVRVNAAPLGRAKVEVAAEVASTLGADHVETLKRSCLEEDVLRRLLFSDVIIGATDNHASRILLNRVAIQGYVPLIDTGIEFAGGGENGIARADLIGPGSPCLECRGILVADRPAGAYGAPHEEPSIGFLNALTASLACRLLVDHYGESRFASRAVAYQYRVADGILKPVAAVNMAGCTLCAEVVGRGDSLNWPIQAEVVA